MRKHARECKLRPRNGVQVVAQAAEKSGEHHDVQYRHGRFMATPDL